MFAFLKKRRWGSRSLLLLVICCGAFLYACSPAAVDFETYTEGYQIRESDEAAVPANHHLTVVVHRGANREAPENTFAAAVKAIALGAAYVEIDVQRSLDGVHYILHDHTLGRTTNGWGLVRLRTAAYIDSLDAGSWFGDAYRGEKVPRLKEYLQWIKGKAKVYLDVKTADLETVVALIRELQMEDEVFFWFWNPHMLQDFRKLAPKMHLKINAHTPEEALQARRKYHASIIECRVWEITPDLLRVCRANDIKIMAYADSNTAEEYKAMIYSEADMVNLDDPALYAEVLQQVQK